MFFRRSSEQQQLRVGLRAYFAELLTDAVRAGLLEGDFSAEAKPGFRAYVAWERTAGSASLADRIRGQGRSATDQLIFFEEVRLPETFSL